MSSLIVYNNRITIACIPPGSNVASLCIRHLMKMKLTDMFKYHFVELYLNIGKLMQEFYRRERSNRLQWPRFPDHPVLHKVVKERI